MRTESRPVGGADFDPHPRFQAKRLWIFLRTPEDMWLQIYDGFPPLFDKAS